MVNSKQQRRLEMLVTGKLDQREQLRAMYDTQEELQSVGAITADD